MLNKIHRGKVLDRKGGFKIIECRPCGFRHTIPLPSDKKLRQLYGESFYTHEKPAYFRDVEEDKEWWFATYHNYYSLLEKYAHGRKLLEVGSGPGLFLKCGKARGWDVLGIEPSLAAIKRSRRYGVKVRQGFFDSKTVADLGRFDVIYMQTVLEHVPDPEAILKLARSKLKRGGLIMVVSPNDYNPLQEILRSGLRFKPWWVAPPQHLNYFNFKSMGVLLKKLRFKIMDELASFPMEFFLLSGENYVENSRVGRACQAKRKIFEEAMYNFSPESLNEFYRDLAVKGIGRTFVIMARKK